mmetsp:Transcript_10185/g.34684  ORF Transcript_10185/g.34684 Transcript_10185/m.34684 type:complete len:327 (-) Transcript_10185:45-1025(-)
MISRRSRTHGPCVHRFKVSVLRRYVSTAEPGRWPMSLMSCCTRVMACPMLHFRVATSITMAHTSSLGVQPASMRSLTSCRSGGREDFVDVSWASRSSLNVFDSTDAQLTSFRLHISYPPSWKYVSTALTMPGEGVPPARKTTQTASRSCEPRHSFARAIIRDSIIGTAPPNHELRPEKRAQAAAMAPCRSPTSRRCSTAARNASSSSGSRAAPAARRVYSTSDVASFHPAPPPPAPPLAASPRLSTAVRPRRGRRARCASGAERCERLLSSGAAACTAGKRHRPRATRGAPSPAQRNARMRRATRKARPRSRTAACRVWLHANLHA